MLRQEAKCTNIIPPEYKKYQTVDDEEWDRELKQAKPDLKLRNKSIGVAQMRVAQLRIHFRGQNSRFYWWTKWRPIFDKFEIFDLKFIYEEEFN